MMCYTDRCDFIDFNPFLIIFTPSGIYDCQENAFARRKRAIVSTIDLDNRHVR